MWGPRLLEPGPREGLCSRSVMSDSLWPRGLQPTRLLCPWDFSGKNTGVGCPFLSRGSSRPGDHTRVSCTAGRFFTTEPLGKPSQGHRRGLFTRLNLSYPLLSGCSSLLSASLNFQSLRSFTPMGSEASWPKAGKPDGWAYRTWGLDSDARLGKSAEAAPPILVRVVWLIPGIWGRKWKGSRAQRNYPIAPWFLLAGPPPKCAVKSEVTNFWG